jgi:hypothetical protein
LEAIKNAIALDRKAEFTSNGLQFDERDVAEFWFVHTYPRFKMGLTRAHYLGV